MMAASPTGDSSTLRDLLARIELASGLTNPKKLFYRATGLSKGHMSQLKRGNRPLHEPTKRKLRDALDTWLNQATDLALRETFALLIDELEALPAVDHRSLPKPQAVRQFHAHVQESSNAIPVEDSAAIMRLATSVYDLDDLPIENSLQILRAGYGDGVHEIVRPVHAPLSAATRLAASFRHDDQYLVPRDLFESVGLEEVLEDRQCWVPRNADLEIEAGTAESDSVVALLIATNHVYPQSASRTVSSFSLPALFGRGGIADFVHADGSYQTDEPLIVGNEQTRLGSLAVAALICLEGHRPIVRSNYYAFVRKGIRYPDDVWWDASTGAVLANGANIAESRIAFETRRPNGSGRDIFVCDFDGDRMVDATSKEEIVSSTLIDALGHNAFRWTSAHEFECAEMVRGRPAVSQYRDPVAD
jgi:hypothetical protein